MGNCEDCYYVQQSFVSINNAPMKTMFVCKRNPPSIVNNNRSEFPKVDQYSCCGEFKSKENSEKKKLKGFIDRLKDNIGRAEDDTWCVLNLNVQEGIELLQMLEEIQKTI